MIALRRSLLALAGAAGALLPDLRRVSAAESGSLTVTPAAPPRVAADHFTGEVKVSALFQSAAPARASGGIVSFAPGARTDWHTHPLGQTLVVLSGAGLVQRWGDPAKRLGPGDVAWIPPGTKHWHGAVADEPMAHVAVGERLDGKSVDWLEEVSDGQYAEATRPGERSPGSQRGPDKP